MKDKTHTCSKLFDAYKECIYKNKDNYVLCKDLLENYHKCFTSKTPTFS